ncbi:MAG: hypothetical protein SH818_03420 [Saprospiraceae bacterium]|nr:hypothetical protein [Saprospiraceae bacterium]
MKTTSNLWLTVGLLFTLSPLFSQSSVKTDSTGLPGDDFSLEGALELFKKASSPEEFEKLLNSENNHVNNLDLNGDGEIDYIKVIDHMDKDVHALVLQATVSSSENQDIAVIEIEQDGKESAVLQIIGDEEIYGDAVIVEPQEEEDAIKSKKGPSVSMDEALIVNVWYWPSVRFIYAPLYRPWVSPWRWGNYPGWWRPWRPLGWHVFHPFRMHYRTGYIVSPVHRVVRAHRVYTPVRVSSVTVRTRHHAAVNNHRVNRTKTTVTAGRGNHQVKATKTRTTVSGKKGNTKVKATKTRSTLNRKKR